MSARLAAVAALGLILPVAAPAADRPVVVELFTSQGCSSCPPADALLTALAGRGEAVLPLAFHITYWNYLGWRDPFSLEASTALQNLYAARFGDGNYTPEMVIDGRRDVVGSQRAEVEGAIQAAMKEKTTAAPVSAVQRNGEISIAVGAGTGRGQVLLVGYDHRHRTAIGRGENAGRMLVDSNAVRSVTVIGVWQGGALALAAKAPQGDASAVLLLADDGSIIGAARTAGGS